MQCFWLHLPRRAKDLQLSSARTCAAEGDLLGCLLRYWDEVFVSGVICVVGLAILTNGAGGNQCMPSWVANGWACMDQLLFNCFAGWETTRRLWTVLQTPVGFTPCSEHTAVGSSPATAIWVASMGRRCTRLQYPEPKCSSAAAAWTHMWRRGGHYVRAAGYMFFSKVYPSTPQLFCQWSSLPSPWP